MERPDCRNTLLIPTFKYSINQPIYMGKLVNAMDKITQRSVGFKLKQILFFAEHQNFKPDIFCRNAVDEQIKLIDPDYL